MKIVGISREKTQRERFALITEPPVTFELLSRLKAITGGQLDRFALMADGDGLLLVTPPIIPANVQYIEEALTAAQQHIDTQKKTVEDNRENFLKAVAEQAGLSLK